MVVTSRMLQDRMGIDSEIADYFANERPVPQNNLFWKNKRIYVSGGFGYLSIPLVSDLIYKLGVSKEAILNDSHVSLLEQGFDMSSRYESNQITFEQFILNSKKLLQEKVKQVNFASDLFNFLQGKPTTFFMFETPIKALTRSDGYLFTIIDLEVTDEWVKQFLPYWYSVIRPVLLLDDFKDLVQDRVEKEENAIIQLGNDKNAILSAYEFGMKDISVLSSVNVKLANYMKEMLKGALSFPHILKELG
jgi:hypothetical protein